MSILHLDNAIPWWRRWRWVRYGPTWARFNPCVKRVVVYADDLSVRVETDGTTTGPQAIHSAHNGTLSFTDSRDGRRYTLNTADLYVKLAEAQGIPVITVTEGKGYPG